MGAGIFLAFSACGGTTEVPDVASDGGPVDAETTPDPACLAWCASSHIWCTTTDTEYGTANITERTANGCSIHVALVVHGTIDVTLDCASKKVCVDQGDGGCTGAAGTCYPADVTATSVSYMLAACLQGSLACYVGD
jgi:hypothetical protein